MAENTNIGWCDDTLNFWWGCAKVSPGCAACYAEQFDRRVRGSHWGAAAPRRFIQSTAAAAKKLDKRAREDGTRRLVFCQSMSDLFEQHTGHLVNTSGEPLFWTGRTPQQLSTIGNGEPATLEELRQRIVWPTIAAYRNLTWLLLTKRPENIASMLPPELLGAEHIWLGTTVEHPSTAHRLNTLLQLPAALHFVSIEPQLEPIDLERLPIGARNNPAYELNALSGELRGTITRDILFRNPLRWIITGGESKQGKHHEPRPYDLNWPRDLLRRSTPYEVPVFVKQLGSNPVEDGQPVRLKHAKGEDQTEWPEDLRIQQRPEIPAETTSP